VVEYAPVKDLFAKPRHPYTIGLFRSLPELVAPGERLRPIPGMVPSAYDFPSGCRYRTRCPLARALCAEVEPPLERVAPGEGQHTAACHFKEEALKL
jgi:oligopeptide/dipeptide ABC transporter ATP-binding protein